MKVLIQPENGSSDDADRELLLAFSQNLAEPLGAAAVEFLAAKSIEDGHVDPVNALP